MKLSEVNRHLSEMSMLGDMALPAKLSYAMTYNYEMLRQEAERIDQERQKLCRQYSDKDSIGNPVVVNSIIYGKTVREFQMSQENRNRFNEEYEALLNTEFDIDIRTVGVEEIEKCEQAIRYSIPTVAQLMALSFMLKDEPQDIQK